MRKKIILIACGILALALIVAAVLYFTPKITPVDVTLSAQKWDGWGKEDGTVEIAIKGNLKEYLFKPDVLDVDVTSSDGVLNWDSQLFNTLPGEIDDFDYVNYYVGYRHAGFIKDENITINLCFSSNLNRWMFEVFDKTQDDPAQPMLYLKAVYLASTKEADTWEEIGAFFEPIFSFG